MSESEQIKSHSYLIDVIEVLTRMLWQVSLGNNERQHNLFEHIHKVEVGDLVMETSIGNRVPPIRKIGYLRKMQKEEDGWKHYYVQCLDGETVDWTNCSFIKIPKEYFRLTDY